MAKVRTNKVQKNARKPSPETLRVLIIGLGNMGTSLARGLLSSNLSPSLELRVYDQHPHRADPFQGNTRVQILTSLGGIKQFPDDVIVVCTKPQDLPSLAKYLAGSIRPDALVVSILAAVPTGDIASLLKHKGAVVRAMPNIAATVGAAATALCRNSACDEHHEEIAHSIFASVGTASWTKESLMDAVTGLSGSGPAYIYMIIEALTDGGVMMGLPRSLALELATQTVAGSAKLVQQSGLHPAVLKDQVTTPGGTTITAIHELEERGLRAMLMSAVATATERSEILRKNSL